MTQKTKNILGWGLTALLSLAFIGSAVMKLTGGEEAVKGAAAIGLTSTVLLTLGVVELASIILFIFPRTGILGTLLLAAYLGGAIATHLEHGQPIVVPAVLQAVLWITALIRFPELGTRISGSKAPATENRAMRSGRFVQA